MYVSTGYNKGDNAGARIGNWVEEEALRTATGTSRYEVRVSNLAKDVPLSSL